MAKRKRVYVVQRNKSTDAYEVLCGILHAGPSWPGTRKVYFPPETIGYMFLPDSVFDCRLPALQAARRLNLEMIDQSKRNLKRTISLLQASIRSISKEIRKEKKKHNR